MSNTPEREQEVALWLQFAQEDLVAAEALLEREDVVARHICFFAQQLAEKALKAGLIFSGIEVPRIHDLDELRNRLPDTFMIKTTHPNLSELSDWVVDGRYPGYFPLVPRDEATRVLETAVTVLAAVREDLNRQGYHLRKPT